MLDELGVFTQQREETDETVYRVAVTYKPIRICSHQQRVLLHACSATAQQMCQVFFFFLFSCYHIFTCYLHTNAFPVDLPDGARRGGTDL